MNLCQFRRRTKWHRFANEKQYEAPADPWKLLRVSPDDVTDYNGEIRVNWGLGRIKAGEWDDEENCNPLRETTTYKGLEQRFEEGYDWEETALYRRVKDQFEDRDSVRGYESIDEFRTVRCEYLDELFHKIQQEGYRPNADAAHDNPNENAYAHHLEPLVLVGRSGAIYWTEGYHRFTIASILGIEEIPVCVLCRHEKWQRIRDRIHDTPVSELPPKPEAHLDHPDVQDVIS